MRCKIKRVACLEPTPNDMALWKIISGGQQGVDIAALKAAKKFGLVTGGSMPTGYLTLSGRKPGYGWQYRLRDDCPDYKTRTWKNVASADATLRLATDFGTRGELCTLNAIRHYKKPSLDVYMEVPWILPPEDVACWILSNGFEVLNVAGNAYKWLELPAEAYLLQVLNVLRWE
jgi:hypothetical protein